MRARVTTDAQRAGGFGEAVGAGHIVRAREVRIKRGLTKFDEHGKKGCDSPPILIVWFETLNRDLRYQLTPIGAPGPNLHIAEELANSRFKIGGGSKGMKVSWQVTGIRKDAWANAHRIVVEEDKEGVELGKYLNPELFGEPNERRKRAVEEEKAKLDRGLNLIEKSRQRMADGRQQAEKDRLRISEHKQQAKE